METYELERMGVRQLRTVCKENGKKKYAWLKKTELIFLIQGYSSECGNCGGNLTIEEMKKYLEDPEEYGGLNNSGEYIPCCFDCFQNRRTPCSICRDTYMNNALEWAIMEDGGHDLVCIDCAHCSECSELITVGCDGGIQQENWFDGDLFCNECINVECDGCNEKFHKDTVIWGYSDKGDGICLCEECNICTRCEDPLDTINGLNIDENFYCNSCEPTPCHFCKEEIPYCDIITGIGADEKKLNICEECSECSMCRKPLKQYSKFNWDWEGDLLCNDCPPYSCKCGHLIKDISEKMLTNSIKKLMIRLNIEWHNVVCICVSDSKGINTITAVIEILQSKNKTTNNLDEYIRCLKGFIEEFKECSRVSN